MLDFCLPFQEGRDQRLTGSDACCSQVLLYRLVGGIARGDSPWGEGKLVELAVMHETDDALKTAIYMLLARPWRNDPVRRMFVLNDDERASMPQVRQPPARAPCCTHLQPGLRRVCCVVAACAIAAPAR